MKITVTAPSGHIGSRLTEVLLDSPGVELTVLARTPSKVEHLARRGVRVVAGDQLDAAAVDRALEGAEALFWLAGMDPQAPNLRARYNQFADVAAAALRRHPGLRLVHLSSIGAQLADGTGPVKGLHDAEQKLNAAGKDVTHLRANYFMENVLASLPTIQSDGSIYAAIPGNVMLEQVATADIAAAAAHYLVKGGGGQHVVDVFGPEKISFEQVAKTVGEAIGWPIRHMQVPPDAVHKAMVVAGLSRDMAAQVVELQQAITEGLIDHRVGDMQWQGKMTFAQFAGQLIAPAFAQAKAS